jgi:hypothetical protein
VKKERLDEDEEPTEPSVSTKISSQQATVDPPVYVRTDGTALSKKEIQQKQLDELDSILNEFGIDSTP